MTSDTFLSNLTNAINESISTNSRVAFTVQNEWELEDAVCAADDFVVLDDGTLDVWGTRADGAKWRLLVTEA